MGTEDPDPLGRLLHDINGKCAHLKSAAGLLRGENSQDELELLRLMVQQTHSLVDIVTAYEARRKRELGT